MSSTVEQEVSTLATVEVISHAERLEWTFRDVDCALETVDALCERIAVSPASNGTKTDIAIPSMQLRIGGRPILHVLQQRAAVSSGRSVLECSAVSIEGDVVLAPLLNVGPNAAATALRRTPAQPRLVLHLYPKNNLTRRIEPSTTQPPAILAPAAASQAASLPQSPAPVQESTIVRQSPSVVSEPETPDRKPSESVPSSIGASTVRHKEEEAAPTIAEVRGIMQRLEATRFLESANPTGEQQRVESPRRSPAKAELVEKTVQASPQQANQGTTTPSDVGTNTSPPPSPRQEKLVMTQANEEVVRAVLPEPEINRTEVNDSRASSAVAPAAAAPAAVVAAAFSVPQQPPAAVATTPPPRPPVNNDFNIGVAVRSASKYIGDNERASLAQPYISPMPSSTPVRLDASILGQLSSIGESQISSPAAAVRRPSPVTLSAQRSPVHIVGVDELQPVSRSPPGQDALPERSSTVASVSSVRTARIDLSDLAAHSTPPRRDAGLVTTPKAGTQIRVKSPARPSSLFADLESNRSPPLPSSSRSSTLLVYGSSGKVVDTADVPPRVTSPLSARRPGRLMEPSYQPSPGIVARPALVSANGRRDVVSPSRPKPVLMAAPLPSEDLTWRAPRAAPTSPPPAAGPRLVGLQSVSLVSPERRR